LPCPSDQFGLSRELPRAFAWWSTRPPVVCGEVLVRPKTDNFRRFSRFVVALLRQEKTRASCRGAADDPAVVANVRCVSTRFPGLLSHAFWRQRVHGDLGSPGSRFRCSLVTAACFSFLGSSFLTWVRAVRTCYPDLRVSSRYGGWGFFGPHSPGKSVHRSSRWQESPRDGFPLPWLTCMPRRHRRGGRTRRRHPSPVPGGAVSDDRVACETARKCGSTQAA
jgi:hypothetical protein